MGVQRPAEHHYVRRRPPPEREADRWIEVSSAAGRPIWLDAEIWMRPMPVRTHDGIPAPLAPAVDAAVRNASGSTGGPATVRFLHEAVYCELFPSAVGLDAAAFAAAAPTIESALLAAGCDYVEIAE